MDAMFHTIKSMVHTITDLKNRVDVEDRSRDQVASSHSSRMRGNLGPGDTNGKGDSSFIDLQFQFKKLTDIAEFDFNESHLISKSTVGKNEEESKSDPIPFEY